ncbi:chemotaxis protein CheW [Anaerolineales bacterium HSG6]|nr:chemotaxis protein CheW [Anaerolineales bacterium HSG6]
MTTTSITKETQVVSEANSLPLLIFMLDSQLYGLPVTQVVRIIEMVTIIQIQSDANSIRGLINYQGQAIPVMDLRERFGFVPQPYGLNTPIILVDTHVSHDKNSPQTQQTNITDLPLLGLIVDDVEQVIYVSPDSIKQLTTEFSLFSKQSISTKALPLAGIININRRIILLLDVTRLLTSHEQTTIENEKLNLDNVNHEA